MTQNGIVMNNQIVELKEGDVAPDFKVAASNGKTVSLGDFLGKNVILYFYPKDNTPGCTKEACGFRDSHDNLAGLNAVVLGVSTDSLKSHDKFIEKFKLPFLLLSDEKKEIVQAYGAWGRKKFMGREYDGIFRHTYWIGSDGRIKKVWRVVKPETHAGDVINAVKNGC